MHVWKTWLLGYHKDFWGKIISCLTVHYIFHVIELNLEYVNIVYLEFVYGKIMTFSFEFIIFFILFSFPCNFLAVGVNLCIICAYRIFNVFFFLFLLLVDLILSYSCQISKQASPFMREPFFNRELFKVSCLGKYFLNIVIVINQVAQFQKGVCVC